MRLTRDNRWRLGVVIVGLLGPQLHPLSAVVQEMRKTEQTAQYLDSLGPFFIGKAVWHGTPE